MAWINAMGFVPMSLQWFTSRCLHHDGDLCRFACGHQCFFVVAKATRFAQSQPKGYFHMKKLDRTTEAIGPMNEMWRKLNANMSQYVSLRAKMGQHCSLSAVQRKTAFVEQS